MQAPSPVSSQFRDIAVIMFFLPLARAMGLTLSGPGGLWEPSETADLGQRSQERPLCLGNSLLGSVGGQRSATGPEQIGTRVKWQADHGESSPRAVGTVGTSSQDRTKRLGLWTAQFCGWHPVLRSRNGEVEKEV